MQALLFILLMFIKDISSSPVFSSKSNSIYERIMAQRQKKILRQTFVRCATGQLSPRSKKCRIAWRMMTLKNPTKIHLN